jgi:hypothetical protein
VRLALDEIRFCGANSVQVTRRLMALIKNLLAVLPVERHEALRNWERRVQATIARTFADAEDKQDAAVADRQGLGLADKKHSGGNASRGRVDPDGNTAGKAAPLNQPQRPRCEKKLSSIGFG